MKEARQPMKVLHIISCLVEADGHALFCARLAAELQGRGGVNRILTCPHVDGLPVLAPAHPDVEIVMIQGRVRRLLNIAWVGGIRQTVEREMGQFSPDIVHVHGFWHPLVHEGVMAAKRFGAPVVLSPQGSLTPWAMQFRAWKKRLAWLLYQRQSFYAADVYHACSAAEAADLRRFRVCKPVCIVPIGCDLPAEMRGVLPQERKRAVLFLGRLHPKKGVDVLIKAWSRLKDQPSALSTWQLIIAGPDERGTADVLKKMAREQGVADSVLFQDAVYGAEKNKLYQAADLFVLPSHSENFGAAVVEALSYGVPVIATRATPWAELQANRCGWWIDVGVTALTAALHEALELDDASRRDMGVRGRELVLRRYTWASVAAQMATVYEQAVENYSGERPEIRTQKTVSLAL